MGIRFSREVLMLFVLFSIICQLTTSAEFEDSSVGHPRPSYSGYSSAEIAEQVNAIRKSRPQIHRGGWEWDRLLSRYIDSGRKDQNELEILRAYFISILDRYNEAREAGNGDSFTLFSNHRSWGSGGRMRIFAELVKQDMITARQRSDYKKIVTQSLKVNFEDYSAIERGVNNRPYGINSGPAIAVQMFPEHPNSVRHKPWLDALWRELVEYGDTTETNYYPYGPLYLHGLIDIAEGMNKFKTDREFLYSHVSRYLYYVHGGGVRGNPNSSANIIQDQRKKIYTDPWNAEYYGGAERVNDGHAWYRLAKEYRDPEFLWASEQVCLGGRPPEGYDVPAEYLDAYRRRYFWFIENGIDPKVPEGGSGISYYSPLKHKLPERLFLCPGRQSGKPFVSFFIYDRNNNYMHYCDDSDGKLYEYCVDGAKFLHTSGKYTSGRGGIGEAAYDMLSVLPPDMKFPVKEGAGMATPTGDSWKMASMSIKLALNSREGPDSDNWKFDDEIGKFRRTDQPRLGYSHGNMDGYWHLNDDYQLRSLRIGSFPAGSRIQNLRLAGPKGEKILAAFDSAPKNLRVELIQEGQQVKLTGKMREAAFKVVNGGRRAGKCLEVAEIGSESRLAFTLEGLDEKFDGQNEYTRISYDFKGQGGGEITPNVRNNPRYFTPLWHRGSILVRQNLRAENQGQDSFGQFTMRNYYGANSKWTRQAVLTAEGYLVIRDLYVPCSDVDGYQAAPCWSIKAEGDQFKEERNWFDAPARDHAWWQTQKKRVLLYLHPGKGLEIDQVEHRTSQDIGGGNVRNTFAKATLEAGKPQLWLSVLRSFNEGQDAAKIAAKINTSVDTEGNITAVIDRIRVTIDEDGVWKVHR